MFEPKCDWWKKIKWEDRTVLLKGILSIKREDYGRFVELALDAGMRRRLPGITTRRRRPASSGSMQRRRGRAASSNGLGSRRMRPRGAWSVSALKTAGTVHTGTTWAAPSSRPAPPSSGRVRSSCSWRTGTRPRRRTRASGATRSMVRRCTSKMVISSSTRRQEGHPRGCPFPYGESMWHAVLPHL